MSNFESYSQYYDLLYRDKNYEEESHYVNTLIGNFTSNANTILELGCGSGAHANHLSKLNYEIFGIERSAEMVAEAQKKNIKNFYPIHSEIENFKIANKKFDVAISLFHVMSYLSDNQLLVKSLQNINEHLIDGGIFIFDVWYTPAVYHQKPETRIKRLSDQHIEVIRLAEPHVETEKNLVNVNYEILVNDQRSNQMDKFKETHPMRHFSLPEIDLLARLSNFKLVHSEEFLTGQKLSENTWGVCFVLKKV